MYEPVILEIANNFDHAVVNHPFTIGVPFKKGAVVSEAGLSVRDNGEHLPIYAKRLASWNDGSVKWALLDFQSSLERGESKLLQVDDNPVEEAAALSAPTSKQLVISETDSGYTVDTGSTRFTIHNGIAGFSVDKADVEGLHVPCQKNFLRLIDEEGKVCRAAVSNIIDIDGANSLRRSFSIEGSFQDEDGGDLVVFELGLTFFCGGAAVKTEVTIRNPHAAEHPGGVWDLGDEGSFIFKDLSFISQPVDGELTERSISISADSDWHQVIDSSLRLVQRSSGGENWSSTNHMDSHGEVSMGYRGYRYFENHDLVDQGDRASPTVAARSQHCSVTAHIDDFWQNFPKAVDADRSSMTLGLFPAIDSSQYELQGGEQKQHTLYLGFDSDCSSLDSISKRITPIISREYYVQAEVFPYLPVVSEESRIQQMIDRGIAGDNNFFEKREKIDEYGWRNFGEVFADHELHEYKGNDELISHYNNQYDPVFGFIKQFVISADSRWYDLYTDLARHIVDIDIYHTTEDRDEYNGGLFWHTHHYLCAFTCTHRTFSKHHVDDFIYGEIGGGPGAEHCYTAGLSYYYFMTGEERYKEAVIQLASWLERVFEGSGTVLERLFQFKSKDLPKIKRLLSGESIQRYRYPFTRGTGNYINTLVDAYSVTADRGYISKIEEIIMHSIHPRDDIDLRDLADTEFTWSYLVYLQSVCKYLDLKVSLGEMDDACLYARDSLLHYTEWMLENEKPFLDCPDKLEYTNHTWVAQDLRKANLFYMVSQYTDHRRDEYLEAARYYTVYVEDTLMKEETRYYSRILILLMQNYIDESSLDVSSTKQIRKLGASEYPSPPLYSLTGIISTFCRDMIGKVCRLSISKERRWLSFRVK